MDFPKRWLLIIALLMLSLTGGCKQGPWPLWTSYAAHFIDAQGRVIDHSAGDHTTSEGQAYALFFALADDDRPAFDRVLNWTQANLAGNDLQNHLPAWLWGKNKTGNWTTLDPNPASDADAWMAYTLVEAGRLWKAPKYTAIGRGMMTQIAKREVADLPGFGPMLMPGSAGFQHEHSYTLNPSYLPLFLFDRFASLDPAGPWSQIAQGIPHLLEQSARHGFAMDWVNYIPQDGFYPSNSQPPGSANPAPPVGSYDAIRVYLWAGMIDGRNPARGEILSALPGMSVYLADHDAPPEKVNDQGVPEAQDGPVGFSAAVLPYLRAYPDMSRLSAQQTVRMSRMRDSASGLYGKDLAYYDQNLALFCNGFLDGRFRFGPGGQLQVEWNRS
jgi:endoglucanase